MRKGAQKKKERQLEELLLDRREALGELVLGMYVRNSWDDDLLARGSAEVADVENELNELLAGREPEGPSATEKDFPVTGEHRLPFADDEPMTGEYTAEHSLPDSGEFTQEQTIPQPPAPETSEYTAEHSIPETGDYTAEHQIAGEEAPAKPSRADRKRAKKERKEQERREREEAEQAETATQAKTEGSTPTESPKAAESPKPAVPTPTPAPTPPSTSKPAAAPAEKPATAGPEAATVKPEAKKPIEVPAPPAPAPPKPTDPLEILDNQIDESEAKAKSALESAQATLKADSKTELSAIARDVESGQKELNEALAGAAAAIAAAENKASQAEARLTRETAANREAATEWVRGQAAEIEADAALASEMDGDDPAPATSGEPDPVLSARVTSLEAELVAVKAAKDEALTKAAARLKEIEESAKLAEARVEAAEHSAKEAKDEAGIKANSGSTSPGSEAEAREAAVNWLRGQITALRQEITSTEKNDGSGGSS